MCELYTIVEISQIAPHILFYLLIGRKKITIFASTQIN